MNESFPGGTFSISSAENFLLSDCTRVREPDPHFVHPVALFHAPIRGAGTSIAELFRMADAGDPGSVGIWGYDWTIHRPLVVGREYRCAGAITRREMQSGSDASWELLEFTIDVTCAERDRPTTRIVNSWIIRRDPSAPRWAPPPERTQWCDLPALDDPFVVDSVDASFMKTAAAIFRDPYPVHFDRRVSHELGLGGRLINQGPLSLGYALNGILRHVPVESLRRIDVRFHRPVIEGDHVESCSAVESENSDRTRHRIALVRRDEVVISGHVDAAK